MHQWLIGRMRWLCRSNHDHGQTVTTRNPKRPPPPHPQVHLLHPLSHPSPTTPSQAVRRLVNLRHLQHRLHVHFLEYDWCKSRIIFVTFLQQLFFSLYCCITSAALLLILLSHTPLAPQNRVSFRHKKILLTVQLLATIAAETKIVEFDDFLEDGGNFE